MNALPLSRTLQAWLGAGVLVAAAFVAAPPAHAQPAPPAAAGPMAMHGTGSSMPMGPWGGRHLDRLLDRVKATDEQRAQIHRIQEAAHRDLAASMSNGQALHREMLQLFAQPTLDAAAIEAQRQKLAAHHDEVSRRMTQAMLDSAKVLTPEQRQQIVSFMNQRMDMAQRHARERRQLNQPPAR